jgi:hypothetical protein
MIIQNKSIYNKFLIMSLPNKKPKTDNNIYPPKELSERDRELMDGTDLKTTYLPKSIKLDDLDIMFYREFKDGKLSFITNGQNIPVVFMTLQRWTEFSKTWTITDDDKNILFPVITIKRGTVEKGTYAGGRSTIPNRKVFNYVEVPTYKDGKLGYDLYRIPQPVAVDITYEIRFFSRNELEVNDFLEKMLTSFTELHHYVDFNGHYFPVTMEGSSDEDSLEINADRYYVKKMDLKLKAYIQNENEFEIIKAINRKVVITDVNGKEVDRQNF